MMLYSPFAQRVMMEASKDAEGDDYTDDQKIARMTALRDLLNGGRMIVFALESIELGSVELGSITLDDPCGIVTIAPDGHIALRFSLRDKTLCFTQTGAMSSAKMLTHKGEVVMDLTIGIKPGHDIQVSNLYAAKHGSMTLGECFLFHADPPRK